MDGSPVASVLSGMFAGRYRIERELGAGATATVYLARDIDGGRTVAIKVLKDEMTHAVGSERFLREIRVTEQLHHSHIVPVLDSGEYNGQLYYVLPHMEGGSLRQRLLSEKQLPMEEAVGIARTVADALDYAHKQGFIHRDVKPENILFTSGQACLADFGIARAVERAIDESTTSTGLVRGTPAYMSPEQASGSKHYDGRSDQYSLACVLYEMIAGMPAFIGPTPESVIAQRFQHPPRELRVYRMNVSAGLQGVVNKAMSIQAVDRYATSAEFSHALQQAVSESYRDPRTSGASVPHDRSRRNAMLGAMAFAAVVVVALLVGVRSIMNSSGGASGADTTRYVILPIEGDSTLASQSYDALRQAFDRWQGITVEDRFAVRDAAGGERAVASDAEATRVARRVGAGRYVRARITVNGGRRQLYAALFDIGSQTRLYEATAPLQDSSLATLADELLLRSRDPSLAGTRVLPAAQSFTQAVRAREAFDLRAADSLFLASLDADPEFGRAALWLAQVRVWSDQPTGNWQPWADRAARASALTPDESEWAAALSAMAHGDYPSACARYRQLTNAHARDFALWYSLGKCLAGDKIVIREPRSQSGWRFRTSYQAAVQAYVRAFELAPAMHRTFQGAAYDRLRDLLFADYWKLRPGVAMPPDTTRFYALPTWAGDSLLFIPFPSSVTNQHVNAASRRAALQHQQDLFVRIARSWATALPNNAATKEAVAIALETSGDPRALDTVRLAKNLTSDPLYRLRLSSEEIFLSVALGRDDPRLLQAARKSTDSLLSSLSPQRREEFAVLAPLAALVGKCRLAGHYAARATSPQAAALLGVPYSARAIGDSLTAIAALGCDEAADTAAVNIASDAIGRMPTSSATPSQRILLLYRAMPRAFRLAWSLDTGRVRQVAQVSGDEFLTMRLAVARRDSAGLSRLLANRFKARGPDGAAYLTPDIIYPEARLWSAAGADATAAQTLDPLLARQSWLSMVLDREVATGTLMRSAALRAQLASRSGDSRIAVKWASFVSTLWSGADPELLPLVREMIKIQKH